MRAHFALLLLAPFAAASALAQSMVPSTLQQTDTPKNTTGPIRVGGYQEVLCAAGFAQESVPVNLTEEPSQSVQVTIECNAPFTLDASADFGQLRNSAEYVANDPLTFVPYTVTWPSLLDYTGAVIGSNFTNSGENWAGGLNTSNNPTGSLQIGTMTVSWGAPPAVIAGDYTDTFELNIVAN
jgi:hypothetical protein